MHKLWHAVCRFAAGSVAAERRAGFPVFELKAKTRTADGGCRVRGAIEVGRKMAHSAEPFIRSRAWNDNAPSANDTGAGDADGSAYGRPLLRLVTIRCRVVSGSSEIAASTSRNVRRN